MTTLRVGQVAVEAPTKPTIKMRSAQVVVEVVVVPAKSGWSVGTIKIGG